MIYLDTNVVVYAIENHPKYGTACKKILEDIESHKLEASASVLVLVELINVLTKLNRILKRKIEALPETKTSPEFYKCTKS